MKLRGQIEKQRLQLRRGQVGSSAVGGKTANASKENVKPIFGSKGLHNKERMCFSC